MPIDVSTLSPEDLLLMQSTDFLPELGTLSTTENGLLKYATNPALEGAERPNWFQRLVRAGNLLYDAMNYGGERAAAGDAARAAGMLGLFSDSPLARRQSDLSKELLESAIVNGNQGINKSLGQISGTIPISMEQTIGDTLGLALSAFGLKDAGKAAGQAIGSLPSWYRAGRAANAIANAPWNVGASTPEDVLRNFAKLGEQEQMYRTIARDALGNAGVSLDNAARTMSKTTPAILAGDVFGDVTSDLPYNAEAEARLAEIALSEPTSLKPTGTDTAVPTTTLNNYEAFNPSNDSVLKSAASTSDGSSKTFEEQSYENTQKFLNASKETQQKWYDKMNQMRDNYNKQIQELRAKIASTETQESERKKYIDQLIETENKFVDEYWDNPINWILALPMAALDMRQFRNPVSMWNQRAMDYAQSQPEVRALMLKLGYTKDLPSQRDVLKDELGYIDNMSKADLSWLDQQRKDEQALLNAIIQAQEQRFINRERESKIKANEARADYWKRRPTISPQEALLNLYGGSISSFNNPSTGASPFVEDN